LDVKRTIAMPEHAFEEAMMDATTIMTIDQLMCSDLADERVELIAGVVYRMTPAGGTHGLVCSNVVVTLGQYVRARSLGALFTPDTGFLLKRGPDTLRCPDVAFVSAQRLADYGVGPGMMTAPPDLAVEILSPSNSARYMNDKIRDYFDAGVRLVWVIDPSARTVTRWAPGEPIRTALESDAMDGGDVVPGFSATVASFFEGVPRG
jgi:Uma2 family endonuclease